MIASSSLQLYLKQVFNLFPILNCFEILFIDLKLFFPIWIVIEYPFFINMGIKRIINLEEITELKQSIDQESGGDNTTQIFLVRILTSNKEQATDTYKAF